MKTLFLVIAGAIVLSSCEKNYTCTCVYPNSSISTSKTTFKTAKKSDAETSCGNLNTSAKVNGGACAL
jgi:hypothetical protein